MTQLSDSFDAMGVVNPPADVAALRSLAIGQMTYLGLPPTKSKRWLAPVAVEVGTWAGATARMLADLRYVVFCVDHWLGNPHDDLGKIAKGIGQKRAFEIFCRNMGSRLYHLVFPLIGTSKQHAAVWPHHLLIDFLFIDADHTYERVREDIAMWSPLVRPGGIISGHDYHPKMFPGVVAAVQQTGPFIVCEGSTIWYRVAKGE